MKIYRVIFVIKSVIVLIFLSVNQENLAIYGSFLSSSISFIVIIDPFIYFKKKIQNVNILMRLFKKIENIKSKFESRSSSN